MKGYPVLSQYIGTALDICPVPIVTIADAIVFQQQSFAQKGELQMQVE
jgi:hypothetical protein